MELLDKINKVSLAKKYSDQIELIHYRSLPSKIGVYYFLSEDGALLYIGKSIDIKARIQSHLQTARIDARVARMMQQTVKIGWIEYATELEALIYENAEIKDCSPLFNRRQRRLRKFWSWVFPSLHSTQLDLTAQSDTVPIFNQIRYGFFKSRRAAQSALLQLAKDADLCLKTIGLETGSGPCFGRQLKRCNGVCIGLESKIDFLNRMMEALLPWQLEAWPYSDALCILDKNANVWHRINAWSYQGSFTTEEEARQYSAKLTYRFDRDEYHILKRFILNHADVK
ncbi:MAG: GIY-YIG nuclease family protein [Pseudomonadota bacterium]